MRIAVLCKHHLDELEQYRTNVDGDGDVEILVEPCEKCMADERDEAYALGVKEGERSSFMSDIEEVKSFEELLAKLFKRTPWYRRALRKIRWKLEDALDFPKTLYRATKKFIQRGRRGWADEDVWNLDHYLSGVLAETLRHLADTAQCYPPEYGDFDSWRTTLLAMAGAFEKYHGREPGGCSKLTAGDWDCMGRIFTGLWD